jgi:hypothetical protein
MLAVSIDLNKFLVPMPQDYNEDGVIDSADLAEFQELDFVSGILDSFSDAPGGLSDELKEWRLGIGLEYTLRKIFMLRAGYFTESQFTGFRRFFTLGSGIAFKSFQIDLSYLFSTAQVRNPLENTLRFSLSFNSPN